MLPPPGSADVLYVVDLSCWMYRLFKQPGVGGRAAHEFISFIGKILRQQRPAYMAICADLPFPTFRNALAPKRENVGYKANREPPDPTLLERIRWAKEMVQDVFGIPVFACKGFEADDLIAALVKHARDADLRTVILALDKDLLQLVDGENVFMWDGKQKVWGVSEVIEKFGVRPDQLRDYLAIVGDSADNIPGVKGAGPKAAAEILQAFGTLEAALDGEDNAPLFAKRPRYRDMLRTNREMTELSMKLATLAEHAPLNHKLQECRVT